MTSRQSNAYVLSALLHGAVAALVLFLGYTFSQNAPETAKVFELVAGVGDNYAATEAPALGIPGGIKAAIPTPPTPVAVAAPMEAAPPPAPIPAAAPTPKAPSPAKPDDIPNFAKLEQRAANRKAAHLEAVYKKQLAAEKKKQESYEQYLKEQSTKAAVAHASASTKAPKVDAEGIAEGVVGGSAANKKGGAGGKALTREEGDERAAYIQLLRNRLGENQVSPPGVSDKLEVYIEFVLGADGSLTHVHVLRSSGSPEFDDSVREAFAHTHMPSPPSGFSGTHQLTFRLGDNNAP